MLVIDKCACLIKKMLLYIICSLYFFSLLYVLSLCDSCYDHVCDTGADNNVGDGAQS